MQVVCDHERRIRDVFIGYPGSVHDSRVFRVSPLSTDLAAKCGENRYILGDSGYPCTRHLLTPFRDRGQLTAAQRNFNNSLSRNRYIIEHCFGLLKQKFRQLYHVKLRNSRRICRFIRACCVLHNLAIDDTCNFEDEIVQEAEGAEAINGLGTTCLTYNENPSGPTILPTYELELWSYCGRITYHHINGL